MVAVVFAFYTGWLALVVWLLVGWTAATPTLYSTGGTLADLRVTDVCHVRLPMGWRLCVNMSQEVSLNCVKK